MTEQAKVFSVFKSTIPSCIYITKKGKYLYFVNGQYATANEEEIKELTEEIEQGHPSMYIPKEGAKVTSEDLDPMSALRKKFFAEFQQSQAKAMDAEKNVSTSSAKAGAGTGVISTIDMTKLANGSASS